jgi:uncharacterized membrane protein YhfC
MKFIQISVLVVSMIIGMQVFSNDNYEIELSQLVIGFIAVIICFFDILSMFGTKEEK